MTTTREDLEDTGLKPPDGSSPELAAVIYAADQTIKSSILLLASGHAQDQPDLIGRMRKDKLLGTGGLDDKSDYGAMAVNYTSDLGTIRGITADMKKKGDKVTDATVATFDTSNHTYRAVTTKVDALKKQLAARHQKDQDGNLTAGANADLLSAVLTTVDGVHRDIGKARNEVHDQKRRIHDSIPTVPDNEGGGGGGGGGGNGGGRFPSSAATPVVDNYVPADPGSGNDVVKLANDQYNLGAYEPHNDNHVVYKKDGKTPKYDLNGQPWCASFATWVWQNAGVKLPGDKHWTNADFVPALWSDAQKWKLSGRSTTARRGDMIVFKDSSGTPGHVGIVESVQNGKIYTIEGNSGDAISKHNYRTSDGTIAGIIHKPANPSAAAPMPGATSPSALLA